MAFQNFALYPHLCAFANIASPLEARGRARAEIKERVEKIAALLRIGHVLGHYPRELSNGQKQRTSLARALGPRPGRAAARRSAAQRRRQAALRDAPGAAAPAASFGSAVIYVTQDYREAMALGRPHRRAAQRAVRAGGGPDFDLRRSGQCRDRPPVRRSHDQSLPLPPSRTGRSSCSATRSASTAWPRFRGREVLIGIRPEDVEVTLEPVPDAVPAELDAVTPLNVRAVLYLRGRDGEELLATVGRGRCAALRARPSCGVGAAAARALPRLRSGHRRHGYERLAGLALDRLSARSTVRAARRRCSLSTRSTSLPGLARSSAFWARRAAARPARSA